MASPGASREAARLGVGASASGLASARAAARKATAEQVAVLLGVAEAALDDSAEEALEVAREAAGLARGLQGEPRLEAEAGRVCTEALRRCGRSEEALRLALEAAKANDGAEQVRLLLLAAQLALEAEQPEEAERLALQVGQLCGEGDEAQATSFRLLAEARLMEHRESRHAAAEEASAAGARALELCRRLEHRRGEAEALAVVAQARLALGDAPAAICGAKEALGLFEAGDARGEASAWRVLAEAQLLAQAPTEALEAATRALELGRSGRSGEAAAWHLLARICFAQEGAAGDVAALASRFGADEAQAQAGAVAVPQAAPVKPEDGWGFWAARRALALLRARSLEEARVRLSMATASLDGSDLEEAVVQARTAAQLCGDRATRGRTLATALQTLSRALLFLGRMEDARVAASQALSFFAGYGDSALVSLARHRLLDALVLGEDYTRALKLARQERVACQEAGHSHGEAVALRAMARIHFLMFDTEQALAFAEASRSMALPLGDAQLEADAVRTMADIYLGAGETQRALESASEVPAIFRRAGEHEKEIAALQALADYGLSCEEADAAVQAAEEARAASQRLPNPALEAASLRALSDLHLALKNPEKAREAAKEARSVCEAAKDVKGEASALYALAGASLGEKDLGEALRSVEEVQELGRRSGDRVVEVEALRTASNVHLVAREHGKAVQAMDRVRDACRGFGDPRGEVAALQAKADLQSREAEDASDALREAREVGQQAGDCGLEAAALETAVRVHLRLADREGAVRSAYEAGVARRRGGDLRGEARALLSVARLRSQAAGLPALEGGIANGAEVGAEVAASATEAAASASPATEALAMFVEAGDRRGAAEAALQIAAELFQAARTEDAMEAVEQALPHLEFLGDREGMAEALRWASASLLAAGATARASAVASRAVGCHRQAGGQQRLGFGMALLMVARAELAAEAGADSIAQRLRVRRALEASQEAAAVLSGAGERRAAALELVARCSLLEYDSGGAASAARGAFQAYEEARDHKGMGAACLLAAKAYALRRQAGPSQSAAKRAMDHFGRCGHSVGLDEARSLAGPGALAR